MEVFCSDDSWWNEYINFPDDTPDSPPCSSAHDYYHDSSISSSIAGLYYCPGNDEIAAIELKQHDEMQSVNSSFGPSSPSTSLSSLSSFSSSAASPCSSFSPSLSPSPSPAPSPPPPSLSQLSLEALAVPPQLAEMVLRSCRSSVSPPPVTSPCRKGRRATSMPVLASADVLACPSYEMRVPTSAPTLIRSTGCIKTRRLARSRKSPYPVKIALPEVETDDDGDSEYVPSSAEDDDYSPPGSPARVPSPNSSVMDEEPPLSRTPRSKQERKDVCLKCNQTFTRAADLRRHMKIHQRQSDEEILRDEGEYRIWCKGCHRILARIDARQRHETTCANYKALPASVRRLDRPRKHQKTRRARF
ncbi:hypothetical protein Hypma_006912 [Hypsizygus marmoreus]|uniref:C2H2-type domain-containing protein n=1 Tax=Hypsizygus marmoreus TaxID=39966 RepID=A0A369JUK7_HYPMA|nr:hypothetical protein Hypma_006912 [Hypsizygus marmoreus]